MTLIHWHSYLLLFLWNIPCPTHSFKDVKCPPDITRYCLTGRQGTNHLINGKYSYAGCHHDFPYYKITYTTYNLTALTSDEEPLYISFNDTFNVSVIQIGPTYTSSSHYALCFEQGLMDCNKQWIVWNTTGYHKDPNIHFGTHCSPINTNLSLCNANPNEMVSISVAFDSMNMSSDYSIVGCYGTHPYFTNHNGNFYLYGKGTSPWVYPWYISNTLGDYDNFTAFCRLDNLTLCASNDINFFDVSIDDKYLTTHRSERNTLVHTIILYVGIPLMSIYVLYAIIFSIMASNEDSKPQTTDTDDIKSWLESKVGLEQYTDHFLSNGYERFDIIMDITTTTQLSDIGVASAEHQTQILQQISILKNTHSAAPTKKIQNDRAGTIDDKEDVQSDSWKKKTKFIAKCVFALLIKPCLEVYDYYTDIRLSSEWINGYDYGFGHGTTCTVDLSVIAVIMIVCSTLGFIFGAVGHTKMVKQTYFADSCLAYQSLSDLERSKINYLSFLKLLIENVVTVVLCLTVAWDTLGSITTTSWFFAYYSSIASLLVSVAMFINKERKTGCGFLKQINQCLSFLITGVYVIFVVAPAVLFFLPLVSLSDDSIQRYKMGFAVNSNGEDVICRMYDNYGYDVEWYHQDGYTNMEHGLDKAHRIVCMMHDSPYGSHNEYVNAMRCNVFGTESEKALCAFSMMVNECVVNKECAPYSDHLTVCFGYPGTIL